MKSYEYNLLTCANQFTKDILELYTTRYKQGSQLLDTLTSKYLYIHKCAALSMNLSGLINTTQGWKVLYKNVAFFSWKSNMQLYNTLLGIVLLYTFVFGKEKGKVWFTSFFVSIVCLRSIFQWQYFIFLYNWNIKNFKPACKKRPPENSLMAWISNKSKYLIKYNFTQNTEGMPMTLMKHLFNWFMA